MKKLIITALLFVAAVSTGYAQAGTGAPVNFNATATVLATLTVNNTTDLAFSDVIPGGDKTVELSGGAVVATYGTGTVADFDITGSAGKEVGAYLTATNDLSDGTNTLPITTWVAWTNPTDTYTGATSFAAPTAWGAAATVTLGGATGEGYMWLGATVTPAAAQVAGSYSSVNTFTFYYTGN